MMRHSLFLLLAMLAAPALMRGQQWPPAHTPSSAFTLRVDPAVIEPGQRIQLRLSQPFSFDTGSRNRLTGTVALLKPAGDLPVRILKELDPFEPDLSSSPKTLEVIVPEVADGNYRISVILKSDGGNPVSKTVAVHIERGLMSRFAAAKTRADRIESQLKQKGAEKLLSVMPSARYHLSLSDLAARSEIRPDRVDYSDALAQAQLLLDSLEKGEDPFMSRRGDFKKAYLSKADGTLQPYRVFIPAGYNASAPFPLIIALHAMGRDENSYFDDYKGIFKAEAEKRNYLVACPKGRTPASMYQGPAERDVLDVIAEVRRSYNVDPDRIYITGHSMGGYGAWSIAMSYPDLFAAIAPVAGGGNPVRMRSIAHVPQLVVHGDSDRTVPVYASRIMVEAARRAGAVVKYIEVPGGGHVDVVMKTVKDVFDWFDLHRKHARNAA